MTNQNPEQIARDNIDKQLTECGWIIQKKKQINLSAGLGVAVTEYQTEIDPADYVLFVEGKPVGIIEAKKEEEGVHLTIHEDQSKDYADSKLKYLNNDPLPFVCESTAPNPIGKYLASVFILLGFMAVAPVPQAAISTPQVSDNMPIMERIEAKIIGGNVKENVTNWGCRQLARESNRALVIAKLRPIEEVAILTTAGVIPKPEMKNTPTKQKKYLLSDSDIIFWTLIFTVFLLATSIITTIIILCQMRRERKKLLNTFRNGQWLKSSNLSYHQFKEARIFSKYLHREDIEKEILGRIANKKHIVLTGTPLRGKTRTMIECIRQLKETSVLIPYPADFNNEIIFPKKQFFKGKNRIIVFNDLQKFFEPPNDPRKLIDKIIEKGWIIVANCRTIEEWNTVKKFWGISSNVLEPIEIPEADNNLATEVAALNRISLPPYFDGRNIGTVFVDLDEMRLRYDINISNIQKEILKIIKKLFLVGIYNSKGEILLSSIKKLSDLLPLELTDSEWIDNMRRIIDKGFVFGTPFAIVPEQIYIDRIIEPQLSISEVISDLIKAFPTKDLNLNKLIYSAETPQKASIVIQALQNSGIKTNIFQLNILMAKQNSIEQGKKLLNKIIEEGFSPNIFTYNTLINLCRDYKTALALKDEMIKKFKITPDVLTYTMLIILCGDFKTALALKDEMIKKYKIPPDVLAYNILINLCGDFKTALALKDEMIKEHKIFPDVVTYNMLIKRCGNYKIALALKDEMIKKHKISPSVRTYNELIDLCRNYEIALALKSEMIKEHKITPDVFTYNTLMNLCRDYKIALALKDEMIKEHKITPDVVTYNTLINLCRDYKTALALKDEMIKEHKITPDAITCNTLISICSDFNTVLALKDEMIKKYNITLSFRTYNELINHCQDFKTAFALKDEMIKKYNIAPGIVIYTTLLEKVETEEDAIIWITEFCSTNLTPNSCIGKEFKEILAIIYESTKLSEILAIILHFNPLMFFNWINDFNDVSKIKLFIAEFPEEAHVTDFNKLGFANFFLLNEDLVSAKKFLDSVTTYNYYYFKYLGNYWYQAKDYHKAEEKYKRAISLSENHRQRASIYDKLSLLIKNSGWNDRIDEAVEYCKQSISIQPNNSPQSKRLLTYFTIEFNSIDQILNKIDDLKRDFNIGKRTIKDVLKEIKDEMKIELIKNYIIS